MDGHDSCSRCEATGCASLAIDVDVYKNPPAVDRRELACTAERLLTEPMLNYSAEKRREISVQFTSQVSTDVQRNLYPPVSATSGKEFDAMISGRSSLNQIFAADSPGAIGTQIINIVQDEYWTPVEELRLAATRLSAAVKSAESDGVLQARNAALVAWTGRVGAAPDKVRQAVIARLGDFLSTSMVGDRSKMPGLHAAISSTVENELRPGSDIASGIASQGMISGRLVGYPIFDPEVARLASDRDAWSSFGRNRFAIGGGNGQFVVVREGTVVFHKKSLDFDPSAAISAGQAAADLALNVAGALATGKAVKLTAGSDGAAGTLSEDTLVNVGEVETARASIAQREELLKWLLLRIAELLERAKGGALPAALKADFNGIVQRYQSQAGTGVTP